jgi:hypothetical protein
LLRASVRIRNILKYVQVHFGQNDAFINKFPGRIDEVDAELQNEEEER